MVLAVGLFFLYGLLRTVSGYRQEAMTAESAAYGIIATFRPLLFFIVVWIVASRSRLLDKWWPFAVITPATAVILFGLLQQFVLDKQFLTHFGYGAETIPAFQSVDQKTEYARAQSTLRGPNPLGTYLVVIMTALVGFWHKFKSYRFSVGLLFAAAAVLLFFSYSRSAWTGLLVSLAAWLLLAINNKKVLKRTLIAGLVGCGLVGVSIYSLRDNDYVQNTIFHTDENSASQTSTNQVRTQAIKEGLKDVWSHPLGQGLGSAGPASARGPAPKIAENYYIQVAQETGFFGLFLYLAITAGAGYRLFERRRQLLAQILLASLIGISVVNLVSHAWMDDTLSLLWWGLAGIALVPKTGIIKAKHEQNKTKTTDKTKKVAK